MLLKRSLAALTALLTMLGLTFAQDGVSWEEGATAPSAVSISGSLDLSWVYRPSQLNFAESLGTDSSVGWSGPARISFDFAFSDSARAQIELETRRWDSGNVWHLGGGDNSTAQNIEIEKAWIELDSLFGEHLTTRIGLQDVSRILRPEDTGSLYLDLDDGRTSGLTSDAKASSLINLTGTRSTYDPVGITLRYDDSAAPWALELVWVAVLDNNSTGTDDTTLLGAFLAWDFEGGQTLNTNASLYSGEGGLEFFDLGAGFVWPDAIEHLDPYIEIHTQGGDANRNAEVDGLAWRVGARYRMTGAWIEASYWSISGDDDSLDPDVGSYISQDSVEDFAILEGALFGLDVDHNYEAIKLSAGTTTTLELTGGESDNLELEARLGFFTAQEVANNVADDLGTEVDLIARLHLNRNVALKATVALLFGSDMLEEATSTYSDIEDDSTEMFIFGTEIGF
jgi:hypothetical protein